MADPLSVLVVGGGIGGLCLAHGLVRAGIDVQVAERTHARTDWVQGYRIHIDPDGSRALHACLPAASWERFCATVAGGAATFSFRTEQLAPLLVIEVARADDPVAQHHGISRIALREVLLDGLADVVAFGREFERYETLPDGRVRAHFADGTTAEADLLVGADGANSRVRGQLLPRARRLDTGVTTIAGKYPLTGNGPRGHGEPDERGPRGHHERGEHEPRGHHERGEHEPRGHHERGEHEPRGDGGLPPELLAGPTTVLPPGPGGMFTAVWRGDRARAAAVPAGAPPGFLFDTTTDYVFWAYADATATFPPLDGRTGPELTAVVAERIAGWSPGLRRLVAGSAPDTVNALRIRSAEPVTAWPTGPVTLLGDAIHNMTPMAGIGANTALRDADLLRRNLIAAGPDVTAAVADYERRMLDYGFAAVATSLRNTRFATSGHRVARGLLRAVNLVPPLKRRMLES
jgi:2-polyprenyl-6-methoxyphenol hydroxylase-like FAD-dependent oxidoreductase